MSSSNAHVAPDVQAAIIDSLQRQTNPVCAYKCDGTVVFANGAFDEMHSDRFPDGTVGRDVESLDPDGSDAPFVKRSSDGDEDHRQIAGPVQNGGTIRWFEWSFTEAAGENACELVIAWGRDITVQRQDRFKAQHATDRLAESNRDLLEFAQVASHDLQEPLRKVVAFGGRIEAHLGDQLDDKGADYLRRMNGAATRMQGLIDSLLTFARVTTRGAPMQVTSIGEIIDNVVRDLEIAIEDSGAVLEIGHMPNLPVDESQISQLFQNLIGNAIKFRKDDESPYINIDAEHVLPTTFGGNEPPMGWYDITVADNGIGFDQEYASKIFAPFQRLHGRSEYEGTGVGLSVCRRIVERHHGSIDAVGRPGIGTIFTFRLPTAHFNLVPVGDEGTELMLGDSYIDQVAA